MTIGGARLVVVLVRMDLVGNSGEAEMAISTLAPNFDGAAVVLVAQDEEGAPRFYGEPELLGLVSDIPLERMPWKEYPVG